MDINTKTDDWNNLFNFKFSDNIQKKEEYYFEMRYRGYKVIMKSENKEILAELVDKLLEDILFTK